jgi:hypothetical protein
MVPILRPAVLAGLTGLLVSGVAVAGTALD